MAKDQQTLWQEALWDAKRPLLVLSPESDMDAFSAACALAHGLEDQGAKPTIFFQRKLQTPALFLARHLTVVASLEELFIYSCKLPESLTALHAHLDEGSRTVVLTLPKEAKPSHEELAGLHFSKSLPPFDRLVLFGMLSRGETQFLSSQAPDLFLQTPIVTCAWQAEAETFGRWHVSHPTAQTLSEVCAHFFLLTQESALREHVATCLLAGIIAKTKHFRTEHVSPAMLNLSALLVDRGADRIKLLETFYRTRSIETLRLWGSVCARLEERVSGVFSSFITQEDFLRTGTTSEILFDIGQEILQSNERTTKVILAYEDGDRVQARVLAKKPSDARELFGAMTMEGTRESALHSFEKNIALHDILKSAR